MTPSKAEFGTSSPLAGLYQLLQSGAGTGVQLPDLGTAENQLGILKKYDPNAKIVTTPGTSYSNETGQGTRPDTYSIDFDQSKLPKPNTGGLGGNLTNFDPNSNTFGNTSKYGGHSWLKDPSKVTFDENYGWLTPADNYGTYYSGTKGDATSDMIGKGILAATLAVMGGGVAQGLGGGVGGQIGSGAFKFGVSEGLSGGKTNPLSGLLSMFGGQAIPPQLAQLLQMLKGG